MKVINNMIDNPLVSISCITYNHAPFIRQCLEGFMMQKCDFKFEVLIHDDASTDGTADIIREYEVKYPEIVKPIYQKENQYSKGIPISATFNWPRALGKYIAICEGDDYWTDPLKLQKQVDFLEKHNEYSLTCGGYLYGDSKEEIVLEKNSISFDLNTYTKWYTKTLTVVFRNDFLKKCIDNIVCYRFCRDIHLFYHLLKQGKGYYFTDIFGVYNIHQGGICSMVPTIENAINSYNCYKELYVKNKDNYCRKKFYYSLLGLLYNRKEVMPKLYILNEIWTLSNNIKEYVYLFIYIIPIRKMKNAIYYFTNRCFHKR